MQNKGYPADWLYQLKQKNNIVSIIGKYVHLERKGGRYWACCPFHNEKTPSFSVSEDEGFFYCFGCKESGDVISFIMKYESCDFPEAIEILAKNANMEVPEYTGDKEIFEKKKAKERVLKLLDCAYKHYQSNLYLPVAKIAQDYIKFRGFTRRELEDFKLGYSIDWTEMIEYLKKQGFTYKEMQDAGIAQINKSKSYYDPFAGRLIFPIFNSLNECVGFSARILNKGKVDFAKYINTAETIVFHKGRVVFGINLVKALKQQGGLKQIIIVEGQIDVIAMHRAGFKSTVACMGTALTVENAKELKKLSDNVVLCFDGDGAGISATKKSIDILKSLGFNIKVACMPNLPGKHDPDEILKTEGKEGLEKIINEALPVTDFLINNELKNYDLSKADDKGKFTTAVLGYISKLESESQEEPYLEKIRDLTSIPIDILRRDLDRLKYGNDTSVKKQEKVDKDVLITRENGNIRAIKFILSSLIYDKDFVDKRIDYKRLLPRYKEVIERAENKTPISSYFDYFDIEQMPILKDCINFDFTKFQDSKRYFNECVWSIVSQALINMQTELTEKYKNCEEQTERAKIMQELSNVSKALREKKLEEFYVRK